jgi:hypothetical protein
VFSKDQHVLHGACCVQYISLEKKTIFFFFLVMPLDGCTSDVDSGDINNLFPVLPFSDKSTDILVFNIFEKL